MHVIIVKLDQVRIIQYRLAKILSIYSFQVPSSQNHAPFKLVQARCKMNFSYGGD